MFKKVCPWCNNSITPQQLGKRPLKIKPKWFQFSRELMVCPYCANPVKLSKKGNHGLWLMLPIFISPIINLFSDEVFVIPEPFDHILMGLAVIGILAFAYLNDFIKDERS